MLNMVSSSAKEPRTRLRVSLVLIMIVTLTACSTTDEMTLADRQPTPAELYRGRAVISVAAVSLPLLADDHRRGLNRPIDDQRGICWQPTTDAVVEAVNNVIRAGRRLEADELYLTKEYSSIYGWSFPKGTFIPDIIESLLIDSRGRSVTISAAARDFEGNYYDYGTAGMSAIYRIIDLDAVWKGCSERARVNSGLPPA